MHAQTGLVPITDLGAGSYLGFQGGLYPGGANVPPSPHLDDALARAAEIVPRDAAGDPDPHGWIGMIAVGMSNTTHEFGAFERNADADTTRNARLVLIDTGFGGQTATQIANPAAPYWTVMMQRLDALGLSAAQVQVAWLKEAEAMPPNNFPIHAAALRDTLKHVLNILHDRFPNLRLCYVSSRIYGGYSAPGTLNPEPQAYESGFAVKWLIEDQIDGDPQLNHGRGTGDVRAPLLLWGPYLWADGVTPRSDGLVWLSSDLENDHVHPSGAGEQKVAGLLAAFFASDPTAAPWWPARGDARLVALDAVHDAHVNAAYPATNYGADPQLLAQGGAMPIDIHARFDVAGIMAPLLRAKLSLRVIQVGGGAVQRVDDTSWQEGTVTSGNAPAIGPVLVTMPQSSRDGTIGADVTATVQSDTDRQLSFALTTPSTNPASYWSKEGGQPPRLVLTLSTNTTLGAEPPRRGPGLRSVIPNPTPGATSITFELERAQNVDLAVYSIEGRRIRTLARGSWPAGRHPVAWNGRDERDRPAGPGVFVARFTAGGKTESRKVVRIP